MKKNILLIFTTILFLSIFLYFKTTPNNKPQSLTNQNINYYKKENTNRYNLYQNKNKHLKKEDIITYVNIGIDKPPYTNTKKAKFLNTTYILVNKYNYLDKNYIPKNLDTINRNFSLPNKKLVHEAKIAFEQMAQDAKRNNLNIRAISTYRTYSYQKELYDNYVKNSSIEEADKYSARAGYSEHQTGLVVDCDNKINYYENFEKTPEFKWMQQNAHKYGFILRYPKNKEYITGYNYESWHYRYVGSIIATYIQKNNITFEEYYVKFIDN